MRSAVPQRSLKARKEVFRTLISGAIGVSPRALFNRSIVHYLID